MNDRVCILRRAGAIYPLAARRSGDSMDNQTIAEPPIKALVVPVTPLRQNCTFVPGHERL